MLKTIKTFTRNLIIGANVATVIMMLLVGYSGRLNPESFPILSNACLTFPIFLVINVFFLFFWLLFYPKGTLVSLLGIIISYVPVRTYCPLNLKSEKPVGCIKVMTYNVDGSMKSYLSCLGVYRCQWSRCGLCARSLYDQREGCQSATYLSVC